MKSILKVLMAISIMSANVFAADSGLIARYRFSESTGERGHFPFGHYQAFVSELYSNRKLVVKKIVRSEENNESNQEIVVKKVTLSANVFETLKSDVTTLATSEIITSEYPIVCMMMPSPSASNNYLEINRDFTLDHADFSKELTLVDGPHGCWLHKQVHPKEEYAQTDALLLKRSLKILSL